MRHIAISGNMTFTTGWKEIEGNNRYLNGFRMDLPFQSALNEELYIVVAQKPTDKSWFVDLVSDITLRGEIVGNVFPATQGKATLEEALIAAESIIRVLAAIRGLNVEASR